MSIDENKILTIACGVAVHYHATPQVEEPVWPGECPRIRIPYRFLRVKLAEGYNARLHLSHRVFKGYGNKINPIVNAYRVRVF